MLRGEIGCTVASYRHHLRGYMAAAIESQLQSLLERVPETVLLGWIEGEHQYILDVYCSVREHQVMDCLIYNIVRCINQRNAKLQFADKSW